MRKMAASKKGLLKNLKTRLVDPVARVLDDRLTAAQFILLVLLVVVFIFNTASNLFLTHPLAGIFTLSLVPILFVLGGINFILIIVRSRDRNK